MKRVLVFGLAVLSFAFPSLRSAAQATLQPVITTIAGTGTSCSSPGAPCGDGGSATAANLGGPFGVAVDNAGNLYIADLDGNRIRKVDTTGKITTIAGNGIPCSSPTASCGDGGPGTNANLNGPRSVALDTAGNVYITDNGDARVRKLVQSTGMITTVAGNGGDCTPSTAGCGDGGLATSANLVPGGVALDNVGNIYIADVAGNRIRKVSATTGTITTVAGNGVRCSSQTAACGDGGQATNGNFYSPYGVTVDGAGNIYIADSGINRVRKVGTTGIITTVAGTGTSCSFSTAACGDGGAAASANLYYPINTAVDGAGNLYIADEFTGRVRKVEAGTGIITTVAGGGNACTPSSTDCGDGGLATNAGINEPTSVVVDGVGNLYIADYLDNSIRKVTAASTTAMNRISFPPTAVGSSAVTQNVLIQLSATETVSSISVPASQGGYQEYAIGTITGCTLGASNPSETTCTVPVTFTPAYPGQRWIPLQVVTSTGNINFGLQGTGLGPQTAFTPAIITTVAGSGTVGNPGPGGTIGDGGPALQAQMDYPWGVAVDAAGNIYVSNVYYDNGVHRVDAVTGIMTRVAGVGEQGYSGDNGPATSASMFYPEGLALDSQGNLYIADAENFRVRKVTATTGIITTVAGNGTEGYSGDNGPATSAEIGDSQSIALDASGNLYLADSARIRKVTAATGIMTTVAGNGTAGWTGDNGPATSAEINAQGIAVDAAGNLYIADVNNNVVRKVTVSTGVITTVAGIGQQGESGDGGPATSAAFYDAQAVAVDAAGNLYILEDAGNRVRKVSATTGIITTVAGYNTGLYNGAYSGDGGPATSAEFSLPTSLALDGAGNIYISDLYNQRVRKITVATSAVNFVATAIGTTSADSPQTVTVSNIGNASLIAPAPGSGTNASLSANFTFGNSTTCPDSSAGGLINSGADCSYSINFTPVSPGTISGSLLLTDNVLTSPQTISLKGTATGNITPAVTVSASPSSLTTAQSLMVTVGVSGGSVNPAATGSVVLSSGSYTSASTPLSGGSAAINIPAGSLLVGTDSLTATYTPDASSSSIYNGATGSTVVTVNGTAPTITFTVPDHTFGDAPFTIAATSNSTGALTYSVVSGPATVNGPSVTLTGAGPVVLQASQTAAGNYAAATKTATFNVLAAAPTITFTVSDHTFGDAPFIVAATSNSTGTLTYSVISGPATISGSTITLTGIGAVTLQASQAAAGNYAAATKTATFNVAAAAQTITFTAPASPVTYGTSAIALTASASSGLAVKFSVLSGPGTISGSSLTITGAGTVVVAADQAGNTNYAAATEVTRSIVVNKAAPASVTLTASPSPVLLQNAVALSATVSSPISTPTGSVAFFDGPTMLSTVTMTSGTASFNISTLAAGTHAITVQYLGDNNFTTLTSTAASEVVQDFTFSPGSGSTSQTVAVGGTATFTFPIALSSGTTLAAPVTFSAIGLPAGAAATFSPTSLPAGSGPTTVTLTITLPKTARLEVIGRPGESLPVVALAFLLLPFGMRKVRASRLLKAVGGSLALLIILGVTTLLTGCGTSGGGGGGSQPITGTYAVIVTATSGSLSHSSTVTLIVQ